jgi:hypothetical protein
MKSIIGGVAVLLALSAFAEQAFLKQTKTVPPRLEWSREIVANTNGLFRFVVKSPEPFGVTLITGEAYKDLVAGKKKRLSKEDVLHTSDCRPPSFEKTLMLKRGNYYFILENQSDKKVDIRLECFGEKGAGTK